MCWVSEVITIGCGCRGATCGLQDNIKLPNRDGRADGRPASSASDGEEVVVTRWPGRSLSESGLDLGLLSLTNSLNILSLAVVCSADLVEGVVGVLLEFLPDLGDLLVSSQTLLILHLGQSSLLKSSICSLVTSLGVLVDLVLGSRGQGQGVESIVDAGGVEGGEGRRGIEAGEIKSSGLLLCRLCVASLLGWEGSFFFCC